MADEDREQGVRFGPLADELADQDYPITNEQVVAAFGDYELELADGTVTVEETLGEMGETTYEDADAVRTAILNMVGEDAVGREDYTDRGGHSTQRDEADESF